MSHIKGPWDQLDPPEAPKPPTAGPRPVPHRRLWIALAVAAAAVLAVWGLARLFPSRSLDGDDWSTIAYRLGLVVVVGLSLFSRGLKLGQSLRYLAGWSGIFAVLALGYAYRGEMAEAGLRLRAELLPGYAATTGAHELVLGKDADGGFSVVGQVNGQPVTFAVDTGASDIVLSPADARRLGVDPSKLDFSRHFETANGVGDGAAYTAQSLAVGPIHLSAVPMSVNRAPMTSSLLGMAFLRRLQSFEVKDDRLYLRWRG
jgi:aspartyl protease family protein